MKDRVDELHAGGTPLNGNSGLNCGLSTVTANGQLKNIYILMAAWPSR